LGIFAIYRSAQIYQDSWREEDGVLQTVEDTHDTHFGLVSNRPLR